MLVYVGDEEKGYWTEDVAKKHGWSVIYVKKRLHIEEQLDDILAIDNCKVIVYDIDQYATPAKEVAAEIKKIQMANQAMPVIDAMGVSPQSDMIMHLHYQNIFTCIFADRLGDRKEELEECIAGNRVSPDVGQNFPEEESNAETASKDAVKSDKVRTIGIAGSIRRMGTTTQAIQLIKYLSYKGYTACYIEMNDHGWIEQLIDCYEVDGIDEMIGKVIYKDVEMYYKIENLPEILKKDYDYYVYDYGVYDDKAFNKISFMEKDMRIFVVGTKPEEFGKTYHLIDNNFYQKATYIFNFIPEDKEEHNDIYELMGNTEEGTFFAGDCRDPFKLKNPELYSKILKVPGEKKTKKIKKKKGFFRRG